VVQDNDYATWRAYSNNYWPAKYLIDKDGILRYQHFGEGAYFEVEQWIRTLLEETGANLRLVDPPTVEDQALDESYRASIRNEITNELYGGHGRNCVLSGFIFSNSSIDDSQYCKSKDQIASYTDQRVYKKHKMYLQGDWINEKERLRHGRETSSYEDYMLLRFAAKSVSVVLEPEKNKPYKVLVTLDGMHLTEANKGADVVIEGDGRSFIVVDKPRMYHVVEAPKYGTYNLKLSSNSADFAVFAFTFGVYAKGP
jgi:hypothetical protein